ncbi:MULTISPECIES: DUF2840 domain-containing protein [Caulobacter]|jgi:hypothetical protein|uniref:Glycosidase n=1 Tax=Caulobacter vibrioides OR37 TaxID=1292034 RepID=R0EHW6_CAUVI|nr:MULTISPECIES: DUF2840 domain-containing protein [Caulobacter]ENZ81619.1 hypothetical protein OR37_02557 [Caulobacter vibrioides OR37]PIB96939.1 DUF2840 domain-containing protein [Caulobacter sp. X]
MNAQVELLWLDGQIERWIRFGRSAEERFIDRRRRVVAFAPGAIFGFVRWRAGDYGTVESRIAVLRAVRPGEPFTTYPFVAPGAEVLLNLSGWSRVQMVLDAIDAIERIGLSAAAVAPDHWRHIGARVGVGLPPRSYDRARHRAWLLRRNLGR